MRSSSRPARGARRFSPRPASTSRSVASGSSWSSTVPQPQFWIEPLVYGPNATKQYALFRDLPSWDPALFTTEGEDRDGLTFLPLLVQRASGEVLLGCATDYPDELDPNPTLAGLAQIAAGFAADFPALRNVPITRAWAGILPFTSDQAPVIDEVMPGLFVGAGHAFGNTSGPVTGRVLSQLIAGREPDFDISECRYGRPLDPIAVGDPDALVSATMSRILVLGGSGEMGSAAVADLVERTDHEVTIGDIRPDAAAALLRRLGAPENACRPRRCRRPAVARGGPRRDRGRAQRDLHAPQRAGHRRGDRGRRPPRRPRLVLPGDAPAARTSRAGGGRRVPDRPRLRCRARADQHPGAARRRPARHGPRHPPLLVHHPPDVDVARDRRDPLRREHRDLARPRGRPARRAPVVLGRGGRSSSPSRTARRSSTSSRTRSRSRCRATWMSRTSSSRSAIRTTRPGASRSCSSSASTATSRSSSMALPISPRRFAAAYIGRRGIGPTERSANVKQVRVEGTRDGQRRHPRLRLRGRAGRAVRLLGHHRHGRGDRRRPRGAGRSARRPSARGRVRRRNGSSPRSPSAGSSSTEREVARVGERACAYRKTGR